MWCPVGGMKQPIQVIRQFFTHIGLVLAPNTMTLYQTYKHTSIQYSLFHQENVSSVHRPLSEDYLEMGLCLYLYCTQRWLMVYILFLISKSDIIFIQYIAILCRWLVGWCVYVIVINKLKFPSNSQQIVFHVTVIFFTSILL